MSDNIWFAPIQDISRCEDTLATLKAMQGQAPSSQLELDISRLEKEIELYSQEKFCYEAQILKVHPLSSPPSVPTLNTPTNAHGFACLLKFKVN